MNKKSITKINLLFILIIVLPLILFFFTNNSLATHSGGTTGGIPDPLDAHTFTELLTRIIGYLILIGAPILAIMVIYGGFVILTAGGSPEKFKTGKDIILYAVIGYIIILVSWGIIYIIGEILGKPDLIKKI